LKPPAKFLFLLHLSGIIYFTQHRLPFNRCHCFFWLNLLLYSTLNPSAKRFTLPDNLKTRFVYNAQLNRETL